MKVISILNHKGGVGKSTIATNIAGYFANQGKKTVLGDFDTQQSSAMWLQIRPADMATITPLETQNGKIVPPDADTDYLILDTPSGIIGDSLKRLILMSDQIIVPIKPGAFDILSTEHFLEELISMINSIEKEVDLCVIGNMTLAKAKASDILDKFLASTQLPYVTNIKQSQKYTVLAGHGLSLFDLNTSAFNKEIILWKPLLNWIEGEPSEELVTNDSNKALEPEMS